MRQTENMIGQVTKNKRAARAAPTSEQFRTVFDQTMKRN